MNFLSSAESLLHVFEVLSISAGVLTVAALIGIAITSRIVSSQNKTEFEQVKGKVAEQQERAAKAEQELLTLKERTRPHGLTDEQMNGLRVALAGAPKNIRIEVVVAKHRPPNTDLSELYAKQLAKALEEAGEKVVVIQVEPSAIPKLGITIFPSIPPGDDAEEVAKLASALYNGLQNSEATPRWRSPVMNEPGTKVQPGVRVEIGLIP